MPIDVLNARIYDASSPPIPVMAAFYELEEDPARSPPELREFMQTTIEKKAELVNCGPRFHEEIGLESSPYRDNIHPNARGQVLLADLVEPVVLHAPQTVTQTGSATKQITFSPKND